MRVTTAFSYHNTYNMSNNTDVHVAPSEMHEQQSLRALRRFDIGDVISPFSASQILAQPNYLTIQLSENEHIMLQPEWLQYTNHSCNPNAFFNIETMQLECVRPINTGEEITFFYPSTEWSMDQPFICKCNSVHCIGYIRGAKEMAEKDLANYRLSPFILRKLRERA